MALRSGPVARQLGSIAARYRPTLEPRATSRSSRSPLPDRPRAQAPPSAEVVSLRDPQMQRLEAVLFLAREPLSSRKLSQFANLADATEARTRIRRLNELYDASRRAFRVEEVAGGYQLMTRPMFASWLRRLEHVPRELRLSAPAQETLAVVAYRQPISRAEVEAVRGVNCGEILRQLLDRDLLRIAGRSEELGRPYLYATTRRFLQLFGLRSLDKLPALVEVPFTVAGEVEVGASIDNNRGRESGTGSDRNEEENDVTATTVADWSLEEIHQFEGQKGVAEPQCADEDDEFEDDELDDDDDDEFEDDELDDEEDEFDDEDDEFEDDEEWEEVDDEGDEGDWEDDEDDDWDDEEEEEEEDWEDE